MVSKNRSHFPWTWTLFVLFFALSLVDFRFSILGLLCMIMPLFQALRGKGKIHCSLHCPRGSFLVNTMNKISFQRSVPAIMRNNWFKAGVFFLLMTLFAFSMYQSNGDPVKIGFAIFRMVFATTIIAFFLGLFFKPRSWCTVCPMGYASSMIHKRVRER